MISYTYRRFFRGKIHLNRSIKRLKSLILSVLYGEKMKGVTEQTEVFALTGPYGSGPYASISLKDAKSVCGKLSTYLKENNARLLSSGSLAELDSNSPTHPSKVNDWMYEVDGCALYFELYTHNAGWARPKYETSMTLAIAGRNREKMIEDLRKVIPEAFKN